MYEIPGSCIRVAFVPEGTSSHSQEFVDAGKSQQAHNAVLISAQILAGTALDLITGKGMIDRLWQDFEEAKKNA